MSKKGRNFDPDLIIGELKGQNGEILVTICAPVGLKPLRPFPTTFWLVSKRLIKIAGKLESQGGVRELEQWLIKNNKLKEWRDYNILHQKIRLDLLNLLRPDIKKFLSRCKPDIFKSLRRGGVGGIKNNNKIYIKCLHLQIASWLALGYHPGAKWLEERIK